MRGKDEKLLDIFNSNSKRFIIPAYQRNYDDELVPYVRDYVRAKTIDA